MYTGTISIRYARALLMFANEAGVASKVYQEALTLRKSFRQVLELRQAMEKPVMTRANKLAVLKQAAFTTICRIRSTSSEAIGTAVISLPTRIFSCFRYKSIYD